MSATGAAQAIDGGILLHVRVTPKGGRDAVVGPWVASDGRVWLALKVSAPPENGAANEAVRRLLAKAAGLARSAVTLLSGDTAREKKLKLDGDPVALLAWLETMGTTT